VSSSGGIGGSVGPIRRKGVDEGGEAGLRSLGEAEVAEAVGAM
jgi:hypothetical protein